MPIEIKEVLQVGPGWNKVRGSDGNEYTLKGDYNWRSNNPGNIEYGDFASRHGAIASGYVPAGRQRGFAIFPTVEAGERARAALQFESPSYKNLSVLQAISRFAPPSENNTRAYANAVAKAAGVSLNTPMSALNSQQRQAFLREQSRVEGMRPGQILNAQGIRLPPANIPNVPKQAPTPATPSANILTKRAQGHNVPMPKARPVQGKAPTAFQQSLNQRAGTFYGKNQPAGPVAAPNMRLARFGEAIASGAPARVSDTILMRMQPQQKMAPAPRPAGDALIARTTALNKTAMAPYPTIATTRLPPLGPAPAVAMPQPRPAHAPTQFAASGFGKVAPTPFARPNFAPAVSLVDNVKVAPTPMPATMRPQGMEVATALSVTPPRVAAAPFPQQRPAAMSIPAGINQPKTMIGSASKSALGTGPQPMVQQSPLQGRMPLNQMMQTPGIDPNRIARQMAFQQAAGASASLSEQAGGSAHDDAQAAAMAARAKQQETAQQALRDAFLQKHGQTWI